MNSGELKVEVPLASVESDCEEPNDSCVNTPSKHQNGTDNNKLRSGINKAHSPRLNYEGGSDSLTGSLEDLVNSFDEKLTMCFQDYQEQVDKIAPVQVMLDQSGSSMDFTKRGLGSSFWSHGNPDPFCRC